MLYTTISVYSNETNIEKFKNVNIYSNYVFSFLLIFDIAGHRWLPCHSTCWIRLLSRNGWLWPVTLRKLPPLAPLCAFVSISHGTKDSSQAAARRLLQRPGSARIWRLKGQQWNEIKVAQYWIRMEFEDLSRINFYTLAAASRRAPLVPWIDPAITIFSFKSSRTVELYVG